MKNSIRFLSRALTGAFVMLTLLGHSLLGQLTSMSITYPESSVSMVEGQEFSIIASLSWDPAGMADPGKVEVTRIYEGIPTDLGIFQEVGEGEPSVSISGLVIPELTGVSNQVTYVLNYSNSTDTRSTQITFTIGTASPVDGELTDVSIDFPMENAQVSVTEPIWIQASVLPLNYSNNAKVDFYAEGYKINGGAIASTNGLFNFTWSDHWVGTIRITARATLNNGTFRESEVRRIRVLPVGSPPEIMIEAVDGTNDVIGGVNKSFTVQVNDSGSLVEEVALYVNGVKVGSSGPGGYPYKFDFLMPQYGIIDVWAMARFSNGNRARSETLKYVLNTGSAPTVELLSPLNGASFLPGSEVKIFATAYDADSLISTIDFFVNDTYVNTVARVDKDSDDDGLFETVASSRNLFEFNYQFPFAGDYRIFAQATDETGRTTRSNVAIVTAGSPDRSIPVVSMSSPASVSSVGVGSSLWLNAHATDEDGSIRSVKFFANGQEIGETVSGWGDDYAFAFNARSPGVYYVYAQAKDNHGKIAQSPTVRLDVKPITAPVPTVYLREIDPIYQDLPAGLETVVFSGEVNAPSGAGVLGIYANGVLLGKMNVANGFFNVGMIPMFVGNASITAAVEDGGNTVVSNARSLRVAPQSKNIDFLDYVINNMLCGYFFEEFLDDNIGASVYYQELVRSLDNGQRTPAEFIHELMMADDGMRDADFSALPALNFARVKNALMIRWALTGQWPTNAQMASDCEIIRLVGGNGEGSGERRLVRLLMPAFQMNFFDGKRIPDSFSDKGDFEDFIKVLFDRKFGVAPTKAQLDRCVTVLQMGGTEWFVRDFLLDEDAMRFGNGTVSTLLGIPNLPNHRLSDYANSASLFIGLLRIVPLQSDVEGRANLPLIQQIQIILDAMPEI